MARFPKVLKRKHETANNTSCSTNIDSEEVPKESPNKEDDLLQSIDNIDDSSDEECLEEESEEENDDGEFDDEQSNLSESGEEEDSDDLCEDEDSGDGEEEIESEFEEEEENTNEKEPGNADNNELSESEQEESVESKLSDKKVINESELNTNKKLEKASGTYVKVKNKEPKLKDVSETPQQHEDEYKSDTSDEEDIRNTVGNIPMNWYDDYPHIGYDWDGKRIMKPETGDELDIFLRRMEDPNFWRTVKDPQTGQEVVLCDADVDLIRRLQGQKIPDSEYDEYGPWIEWFTSDVMKTPLRKFPEHKRSFIPSKIEKQKVGKLVHALKMGWIKPRKEKEKEPKFYLLWQTDDSAESMRRIHNHIPAPKRHLPGHAESYNPPSEYLFDKRELKEWNQHKETPWKRKLHFIPQKYSSLRQVPAYSHYMRERFIRCLDLYLCPRARKMRLLIEPEDLVPKLPNPKDLQPFPTVTAIIYKGHTDMIRSITVEPTGEFLVSGSDDFTVKIWEVSTGRCVKTILAGGIVRCVSWCPNKALSLLAVAADRKLLLVNPGVGDNLIVKKTDSLLESPPEHDVLVAERVKTAVQWEQAAGEDWDNGIRIIVNHFKEIKQVTWHGRGDYFATVMPEGQNRSVIIHQLSKRRSQVPFSKPKGLVQCVLFHPVRPIFFVATQRNIRVYDLAKQELIKKLLSNSKWISSMSIHPGGDNLLVGTYDRKMLWFDLDLSTKPYQTLRLHGVAVRGVAYHKRYPLFASGSDDCSVIVSHGMVYNDLLQNPLIVPVKRLSSHEPTNEFGVFDVVFHPTQPWLFSSGADATVKLYM